MNLIERDQRVIWHPYTPMKTTQFPISVVRGEGVYLYDENGKSYIDAVASWWVNIHGHAHPYIAAKVAAQLACLEHVIFAGFTHEPAIRLAERILAVLPGQQRKVFYSDNGSTAVEVALKMCFQYWHNQGVRTRTKVLAFKEAYHGDTFGAMSVSGRSLFTTPFSSLLFEVVFIDLPNAQTIDSLLATIEDEKETLASFIFEPLVLGAGGMQMYAAAHLDRLIAACQQHGIPCIADEVMTGFGRTGTYFACEQLQQEPDIFCLSKGLTGGTMPMGVTTTNARIFEAFNSEDHWKTLYHGHSFTANPVACAASLASMDLLLEKQTLENIRRITERHTVFLKKVTGHPKLRDVRQTGTILALEWEVGEASSYLNSLRERLYRFFLDAGIILRPLGNIIYILPPYVISDEDLMYIYRKIEEALEEL